MDETLIIGTGTQKVSQSEYLNGSNEATTSSANTGENFNYIDNMNTSAYLQFVSDQHDKAVETTGRKAHIFLLDKEQTEISDVYKEEIHGRVYLPHFTQRAIYKTNTFISQLSTRNYTETEENLEMEFDFARMVHNIHELKSNSSGKLVVKNISKIPLWFEINNKFIIRNHSEILFEKKLEGTIYNFIDEVSKETKLIELKYIGDSEKLDFLEKVSYKLLPRRSIELNLNNSIYRNVDDVISHGTIIVNDRYKVYQVVGMYPRNDNYGRYISWNVQLELVNLAKADGLPNDYIELVKENQYGLGDVRF